MSVFWEWDKSVSCLQSSLYSWKHKRALMILLNYIKRYKPYIKTRSHAKYFFWPISWILWAIVLILTTFFYTIPSLFLTRRNCINRNTLLSASEVNDYNSYWLNLIVLNQLYSAWRENCDSTMQNKCNSSVKDDSK